MGQAIAFYPQFTKLLLAGDLASSTFARGLSSFDEAVIKIVLRRNILTPFNSWQATLFIRNGSHLMLSLWSWVSIVLLSRSSGQIKRPVPTIGSASAHAITRFKTASNYSGYSESVVRPFVVLAILHRHSSLLFQASSRMLCKFRLVFGVCSVLLLQSRRSKVCFCPTFHSLGHKIYIYLVRDRGSGSFQFGINFSRLISVRLGS